MKCIYNEECPWLMGNTYEQRIPYGPYAIPVLESYRWNLPYADILASWTEWS